MPLSNTRTGYGSLAKTFHWLTALGILTMIPLGIVASNAPYDTAETLAFKAQLFSLHKTLGLALFVLALARILWAVTQPKPAPLHPERRAETLLAEVVHWLLYGSLLLVPLSGWIHHAATTGFAPIWWPFGQSLPGVPKDPDLADLFAGLHIVFERVLALSVFLHVAGALKHALIDRDATLARMLPGRTEAAPASPAPAHRTLGAPIVALLVWVGALGVGAGLGVFSHQGDRPQVAALKAVPSDWEVQEGTLGLRIAQFGAGVEGHFEDWTAAIAFEDSPEPGHLGTVDVTVAIGSLRLGTVSDQAMGPDFFDATQFPTATYSATIERAADGYAADGILHIKDMERPLRFPFQLTLTEETANMTGRITLDRRDFGIGLNMTDEGQLGFEVTLDIALTATRATQDPE